MQCTCSRSVAVVLPRFRCTLDLRAGEMRDPGVTFRSFTPRALACRQRLDPHAVGVIAREAGCWIRGTRNIETCSAYSERTHGRALNYGFSLEYRVGIIRFPDYGTLTLRNIRFRDGGEKNQQLLHPFGHSRKRVHLTDSATTCVIVLEFIFMPGRIRRSVLIQLVFRRYDRFTLRCNELLLLSNSNG